MSHYEINVSRDGRHFFATDPRSLVTRDAMLDAVAIFRAKFPKDEGYAITVSEVTVLGVQLPLSKLLEEGRPQRQMGPTAPVSEPEHPPHGIDWKTVPRRALIDALRNSSLGGNNLSAQDKPDLIEIAEQGLRSHRRESLLANIDHETKYRRELAAARKTA